MVTRSITLRLVVPRGKSERDIPRALWSTHEAVNAGCRYYETRLLSMRGGEYETRDRKVTASEVVGELLDMARKAQRENGLGEGGSDEELVALLNDLYADIIPSRIGKDGTAQAANAFLSPLTDPESRGFLEVFDKIEAPEWVSAARNGDPAAVDQARAWLAGDTGQERLHATGSPAKWIRLAKTNPIDDAWIAAFLADLDKKRGQAGGTPTRIKRLKELGVLPLFHPYLAPRIVNGHGRVSKWDRFAFRLAAAHLLSWESRCRRTADEFAAKRSRLERFAETHLDGFPAERIQRLRAYESARHDELGGIAALPIGERQFRITLRMVREPKTVGTVLRCRSTSGARRGSRIKEPKTVGTAIAH